MEERRTDVYVREAAETILSPGCVAKLLVLTFCARLCYCRPAVPLALDFPRVSLTSDNECVEDCRGRGNRSHDNPQGGMKMSDLSSLRSRKR